MNLSTTRAHETHRSALVGQEPIADAVLPAVLAVVGAAADTLVDEARALEDALSGVVEAVDLGLGPVQPVDGEEALGEVADGGGGEASAADGRVDHQGVDRGDPAAAVHEDPAQAADELAVV